MVWCIPFLGLETLHNGALNSYICGWQQYNMNVSIDVVKPVMSLDPWMVDVIQKRAFDAVFTFVSVSAFDVVFTFVSVSVYGGVTLTLWMPPQLWSEYIAQ